MGPIQPPLDKAGLDFGARPEGWGQTRRAPPTATMDSVAVLPTVPVPPSSAAAAAAVVDTVTVRGGASQPVKLARVMRGGSAFVLRTQWVETCGASERQLRDAAAAAEQGTGEAAVACEASLSELAALKAVGATPTRTARAALVQAEWAHSMTRGAATYGAADCDVVLARLLFDGVTPLPATLPTPDREEEDSDSEGEEEAAGAQPPAALRHLARIVAV